MFRYFYAVKFPLFLTLILLQQGFVQAQTQADYERVMGRFMNFYNDNHGDSISTMFVKESTEFTEGSVESARIHSGRMRFAAYMGIDPSDSARLFKTKVVKYTELRAISLRIDSLNRITTLRLFPSSHYIDSLLATQ